MSLQFCFDVSPADWVVEANGGRFEGDVASVVPPVFEAYAEVPHGDDTIAELVGRLHRELIPVLRRHTSAPERCWFCLWEGHGGILGSPSVAVLVSSDEGDEGEDASTSRGWSRYVRRRRHRHTSPWIPPAFAPEVMNGPRVRLPHREYLLFNGGLEQAGDWGAVELMPGVPRDVEGPDLWWPDDRAWFVGTDTDLASTYIGGTSALIADLAATDDLHASESDPSDHVTGEY